MKNKKAKIFGLVGSIVVMGLLLGAEFYQLKWAANLLYLWGFGVIPVCMLLLVIAGIGVFLMEKADVQKMYKSMELHWVWLIPSFVLLISLFAFGWFLIGYIYFAELIACFAYRFVVKCNAES